MFALVDQKHQHTRTSLQSFRQQQNLTNFFPRPAVPTHLSKLFLPIPSCVVFANQNLRYFRGSKHSD